MGLPGKGETDDGGGLFVERCGLEVEAPGIPRSQFGNEGGASRGIMGADGAVVFRQVGDGLQLGDFRSALALARGVASPGLEVLAEEALAEGVELELDEEGLQRLVVAGTDADLVEGGGDGGVKTQRAPTARR